MLSDEEKQAIKELTEIKELFEEDLKENYEVTATLDQIDLESLVIVLNLIEKQSKEIEEYKKQLDLDYVDKHFVPIERYNQLEKEIEELKKQNKRYKKYLKNKDEKFAKVLEYVETEKEKEYTHNDKIKAKIEEIKKYKDLARDSIEERIVIADSDSLNYGRKEAHEKDIEVLQSLLEKE